MYGTKGGGYMTLLSIIIALVLVGVILSLVETYVPMDETFKKVLRVVVIIVVAIWLLQSFDLFQSLNAIKIK